MSSSIITKNLRIYSAKQFKDSVSESNRDNLYLFIGYSQDWANDSSPPVPNTQPEAIHYEPWRYIIAAKKVATSDITHAIPRYDWTSNTVYRQYDSTDENLFDAPSNANTFYVITDDNNVYKCLFNNNGSQSTVKPTGTTTTTTLTADGYIWKFLYKVTSAEADKFKTAQFIPVKYLLEDDSSAQWTIQETASNGSIDVIQVSNSGSGYISDNNTVGAATIDSITLGTSASGIDDIYNGSTIFITSGLGVGQIREIIDYSGSTRKATIDSNWSVTPNTSSTYHTGPKINIKGNGKDASAYANVESGSISKINMILTGVNYSYANVTISANVGGNATAYPILSPIGGHGFNPRDELGGYNVMLNVQITGDESNTVSTNNDFRMVGIISNPIEANGSVANSTIYDQTTKLNLKSVSGSFVEDERVTDDISSAVGFVVNFANTNAGGTEGVLSLTNISNGDFTVPGSIASNSGITATTNTILSTGELSPNKGNILYIQNRSKIERSVGQTEDFKLTVTF